MGWRPSAMLQASFAVHVGAGVAALAAPALWPYALAAVAANQALLTTAGLLPRSTLLGPNLTRLPAAAAMRREIVEAQYSIAGAVGRAPRWFRPTAGLRNPFLDPVLAGLDLRLASWTRRPFDTRCGDVDTVHARLARDLAAGDILLMHDGHAARAASGKPVILEALPRLLARVRECALHSVTLDDALVP